MKTWRRPKFALFALLAMFASLLPQLVWSCPMTGRVGSAATVCASPSKSSSKPRCSGCKDKMSATPRSCCCSSQVSQTKPSAQLCARIGGTCCRLVQLRGEITPNGQTVSSLLNQATSHSIAVGPLPAVEVSLPLNFLLQSDYTSLPFLPPRSYLEPPTLLGRAPPLS